jgi:hypothetical protein
MKNLFQSLKLLFPILFILTALNSHAQEFTLTTTAANTSSSKALIDLPGLTGNPNAIIIANTEHWNEYASFIAGWHNVTGSICNYMVDLGPGTYNIEFIARHVSGKSVISISGEYSSVIDIPLQ